MYKVSIIIPIYKIKEIFLRKTIESAIGQTLNDIEVILIDDGSPDNSGEICDEYANKNKNIKVIHQKNKGLCGARNVGVNVASGEYITFLDGDDWIEKEMCETLYNYAIKDNYDVVCCSVLKDYGNRAKKYDYSKFIDKKSYYGKECEYWQKEILDFNGNISGVYAKLIKRELLIKNNIFHDEELRQGAEGLEFNLRLFEKVNSIFFTNEYFYHYIYNCDSISTSFSEKNNIYVLKCFEKIKKYILTLENKDELLEMFYNRMIYVIITTAISGYFNPANKEKYKIKKQKYKEYLKNDLVQESLKNANLEGLNMQRRIVLRLIRLKLFWLVNLMGIMRRKNKDKKSKN